MIKDIRHAIELLLVFIMALIVLYNLIVVGLKWLIKRFTKSIR